MEVTAVTIILYLLAMLALGVAAYRFTRNLKDYILGGRQLGGAVAALSAGASDMSGWLMLGLPGAIYASGLNQIWIAVGLVAGALLNWRFIARRLRRYTERAGDALTIPDYFENRFADRSRVLRVASAFVILIFFTIYTSAGLVSGAILFEQVFGLDYRIALLVGTVSILSYTAIGGFLGVCWTDTVQGVMMFLALLIVPAVAITSMGGWGATMTATSAVAPAGVFDAFHDTGVIGAVSLMAWGLGYFGQPHTLARFMALRDERDMPAAQMIGMTWMVLALYGAIATGLAGIGYFAAAPLDNPETVFLSLSQSLFNPWIAGILLAAVLAAIMSTVSSQLLVSSSVIAEDFWKRLLRPQAEAGELLNIGRGSVFVISIAAFLLALDRDSSVLSLVAYAWAGFGAAFGPVVVLSLFWRRMTRDGALAGMVVGAVTVIVWKQFSGGIFEIYEILPGFIFASIAIAGVSLLGRAPGPEVVDLHDSVAAG
ncbi:sodium/proline symporter [Parvibaculum lavamentivorans DS-1]|uniref:Sodium/proline symporter n=1 Tax=Parvibaculum lavamentivorans (strain DS-1 / DSM 13023 / NCIMB 13966) TaxID=402881 RepID=A7HXQ9_PARL1|nr:sodium/proline symporter PutP [Parvibaculum lavamentivorans]ABS64692.1 sodium/proline symporter [Parvibaculum lavamentivorans DS-1]